MLDSNCTSTFLKILDKKINGIGSDSDVKRIMLIDPNGYLL